MTLYIIHCKKLSVSSDIFIIVIKYTIFMARELFDFACIMLYVCVTRCVCTVVYMCVYNLSVCFIIYQSWRAPVPFFPPHYMGHYGILQLFLLALMIRWVSVFLKYIKSVMLLYKCYIKWATYAKFLAQNMSIIIGGEKRTITMHYKVQR